MTNEQLALRIKAGEDVADNMLQLYQQNMGIIKDYARKYRSKMCIRDSLWSEE